MLSCDSAQFGVWPTSRSEERPFHQDTAIISHICVISHSESFHSVINMPSVWAWVSRLYRSQHRAGRAAACVLKDLQPPRQEPRGCRAPWPCWVPRNTQAQSSRTPPGPYSTSSTCLCQQQPVQPWLCPQGQQLLHADKDYMCIHTPRDKWTPWETFCTCSPKPLLGHDEPQLLGDHRAGLQPRKNDSVSKGVLCVNSYLSVINWVMLLIMAFELIKSVLILWSESHHQSSISEERMYNMCTLNE